MTKTEKFVKPYSALADIYDIVMSDVDYETWADYIDEIILNHHPDAESLLELACGTGTVALSLEELDCYRITATDGSSDMIRIAQNKAQQVNSEIIFKKMNFLDLQFDHSFDIVYMIFDSINYLHDQSELLRLHHDVKGILNPNGLFIYDFTTPRNSRKAIEYLNRDTREVNDKIRYHRESSFDPIKCIHTNRFEITKTMDKTDQNEVLLNEIHQQKIYTLNQIQSLIEKTDFEIVKAYDGFQLKPAHKNSLRITMVLQ
ncbi:MAG: class I SAM-dependent methyltransferase [Balneolaceae bacterium]